MTVQEWSRDYVDGLLRELATGPCPCAACRLVDLVEPLARRIDDVALRRRFDERLRTFASSDCRRLRASS